MGEDVTEGGWATRAGAEDGYVRHLGLVIDEVGAERVTGHIEVGPHHHQPYGIVHGGLYCSIVETLASYGAGYRASSDGALVVGVHNSTHFLRAHRKGRLDAVATPVHVGRTHQLWLVEISRASDGKSVARGEVRLQVVAEGAPLAGEPASSDGA